MSLINRTRFTSDTADRIVALTGYDDDGQIRDVVAEHDYQHMRAVASSMGLDPDDEDLEETLAEAFAAFRDIDSWRTRLRAGDKLASAVGRYVGTSTSSAVRRDELRADMWLAAQDWSRVVDGMARETEATEPRDLLRETVTMLRANLGPYVLGPAADLLGRVDAALGDDPIPAATEAAQAS